VALVASEGVNVGFAHCVPSVRAVPTQAYRIVITMIAASAGNERAIFSIKSFVPGSAEVNDKKLSYLGTDCTVCR
jgi:hypothetical protein